MRFLGVTSLIAAVLSMAAAPAFAAPANPAAKLSLAAPGARAGAPMKRASKAAAPPILLIGLGVAAVVAGAVALTHSDSKAASA